MPEYLLPLKTFDRELDAGFIVVLVAFLQSRILRRLIDKLRDTQNLSVAMASRLRTPHDHNSKATFFSAPKD